MDKINSMFEAENQARVQTRLYTNEQIDKKIAEYKKKNPKAKADKIEAEIERLSDMTKPPMTEAEIQTFLKEAETKLIKAELDENGVYQPVPTTEQIDAARKTLDSSIMSQVSSSKTVNAPVTRSSGGGGGGGGSKGSGGAPDTELYQQIVSAFNDKTPAGAAKLAAAAASKGKYRFEFKFGQPGVFVYETRYVSDGNGGQVAQDFEIGQFQNARDLAPIVGFATGTGATTSTAFKDWDAAERAVMGGKSTNNKSGKAEGDDLFKKP